MKNKPLGVGIIGCGSVGLKRSNALGPRGRLVACADRNLSSAKKLAQSGPVDAFDDWKLLLERIDIDVIIVATLHDSLTAITHAAINAGKHVLVEKPAGRSVAEVKPLIEAVKNKNTKVRVGFNHRYHRSVQKAREIMDSGKLGETMFLRARYGHGGRIGYEKEWRAIPEVSGGGELIDQGPHLIDLSRWFLGDFVDVQGFAHTYFWDMEVDDNCFMLLKTETNQSAFLHVSCTEWKNLFSMEIYGRNGKLDLSGLGGSYGLEKITWYEMTKDMAPPNTISWEYPMPDNSWEVELGEFYDDILLDRDPSPGLIDALEVLKVVGAIYSES
ncbi:MAG: Gfo/Idh/MocA family oxidoreductase [Pseudomonadota bacterium]|nr:Gfo/Idh/MocA family oxidoreductase [Pseudomonadota bacterium]